MLKVIGLLSNYS